MRLSWAEACIQFRHPGGGKAIAEWTPAFPCQPASRQRWCSAAPQSLSPSPQVAVGHGCSRHAHQAILPRSPVSVTTRVQQKARPPCSRWYHQTKELIRHRTRRGHCVCDRLTSPGGKRTRPGSWPFRCRHREGPHSHTVGHGQGLGARVSKPQSEGTEARNTGEDNGEVGGRQTWLEDTFCRFQAGKQSYTSQPGSVVLKCGPRTGTSGITWALLHMTDADRMKLDNHSFGTRGMYYPRMQTVHISDCRASKSARRGAWVQVTEVSEVQGSHRLEKRRVTTTYVEHWK